MTCIIGLLDKNRVYLAGDSAGTNGNESILREDPKIFMVEKVFFGICGSFRMGQIVRYSFQIPKQTVKDDYRYLCTDFINILRKSLKDCGHISSGNEDTLNGGLLIIYNGNLYHIDFDFQVGKLMYDYFAIGSGGRYALGSLHSTQNLKLSAKKRLLSALEAAAEFSTGVRPPFRIMSVIKKRGG